MAGEGCGPAPPRPADLCEDGNADILPAGFVDEFCELLGGQRPRKGHQDTDTTKDASVVPPCLA